eukprot:jgi/Chlat1/2061/Chrsp17S02530
MTKTADGKLQGTARLIFSSKTNTIGSQLTYKLDDVTLKLSLLDKHFNELDDFRDVKVAVEKPGSFSYEWDAAAKALAASLQSSAVIRGKNVKLTYANNQKKGTASLTTAVSFNNANSATVKYNCTTDKFDVKYSWLADDRNLFEPSYDFDKEAWSVGWTRQTHPHDKVKLSYNSGTKDAALNWTNTRSGTLSVTAILPLATANQKPVFSFEKTFFVTVPGPETAGVRVSK